MNGGVGLRFRPHLSKPVSRQYELGYPSLGGRNGQVSRQYELGYPSLGEGMVRFPGNMSWVIHPWEDGMVRNDVQLIGMIGNLSPHLSHLYPCISQGRISGSRVPDPPPPLTSKYLDPHLNIHKTAMYN